MGLCSKVIKTVQGEEKVHFSSHCAKKQYIQNVAFLHASNMCMHAQNHHLGYH